ncbi:MAG: Wzz/FepE/Etk N-terminal domain-containing protein [Candidatus Wallbacteria bacterium]
MKNNEDKTKKELEQIFSNDPDKCTGLNNAGADEDEINLLDLLYVIAKRARMIVSYTVAAGIIMAIYMFLQPNVYTAKVSFVPPKSSSGNASAMLAAKLGSLSSLAGDYLGVASSNDFYVSLFKSRQMIDFMIDKYKIRQDAPASAKMENIRQLFEKKIETKILTKEGIIELSVSDTNAVLAADMANTLVERLDKMINEMSLSNTRQRRIFLETRLKEIKETLAKCEDSITQFKMKNNIYQIDAQASATISAIGALQGQITAKEIELKVAMLSNNESHPQVIAAKKYIEELKKKLSVIENGPGTSEISYVVVNDLRLAQSASQSGVTVANNPTNLPVSSVATSSEKMNNGSASNSNNTAQPETANSSNAGSQAQQNKTGLFIDQDAVRNIEKPVENVIEKASGDPFNILNDNKFTSSYIVLKRVPNLSVELARLYREQVVQETLFKVITEQYELAKIDEAKESQNITILDKAIPPEIKSGPKRTMTILIASFAVFFILIFLSFIIEYFEKAMANSDDKKRWEAIKNALLGRKSEYPNN